MATERIHVVKVYEHDKSKPLSAGTNPLPLFNLTIPYQNTIPRRERAAIQAVQEKTGREASIAHSPNGDMVATLTTQSVAAPVEPPAPSLMSPQVLTSLLRSPVVQAELRRINNAGK